MITRILDRNYDGRPRDLGGQPFTDWAFPKFTQATRTAPYQPGFHSTRRSGKWCWDCTAEEADLVFPKVLEATHNGHFATCLRSTEILAKARDGFHLILAFTGSGDKDELKRSLALLRTLGVTGEVFWKSDLRTMEDGVGYDVSSNDLEFADVGGKNDGRS